MADFVVDMHVHTVKGASDSSLTPQQLVEEAHRIGLNGVNISEHDRLWDRHELQRFRQESGLFASRAMEVSTELGHIVVLGLEHYATGIHKAANLRRAVKKAGGFMWWAHPFRHFFDPVHFLRDGRPQPNLTPDEAAHLPILALVDDLEVANGGCTAQENAFALTVARILGKRGIGASDAHSTHGLGCFTTVFERPLRDQRELIAQLRSGRYHPAEGLLSGALVAFGESASDINASSSTRG